MPTPDNELEKVLTAAFAEAQAQRRAVCLEHVLAALTEAPSLATVWERFSVDTVALRSRLLQHAAQRPDLAQGDADEAPVTFEFQKILQRAVFRAQRNDKTAKASSQDLLLELCKAEPAYVTTALHEVGMTLVEVADYFEELEG